MPLSLGRQLPNTRASPRRLELAIVGVQFLTEETVQCRTDDWTWNKEGENERGEQENNIKKKIIYLACRLHRKVKWFLWKQISTLFCNILLSGALSSAMYFSIHINMVLTIFPFAQFIEVLNRSDKKLPLVSVFQAVTLDKGKWLDRTKHLMY